MSFSEAFSMSLKNILASKVRTFLTMLGIIIGVCAVIVIVGLGNGMQNYMEDGFAELGTNTLTVGIMGRGSTRNVSEEQMYQVLADNPKYLKNLSPTVKASGSIKIGTETVSSTTSTGVSETYFDIKGYEIGQGRNLNYVDITKRKNVCVIGEYLNQEYFGGNAVGQILKLNGRKLTIVGVMAQEADTVEEGGSDDALFLPYSTAARLTGTGVINSYLFEMTDEAYASESKTVIEEALYDVYEDSDAYAVISMTEILDMLNTMINVMVTILAAIAAISLVVGGIGIMNIMLVSVSERTREIGIRKALGAKERYILEQFVIEAATTSALGGVIGIGLGYAMSSLATVIVVAALEVDMAVTPSFGSVMLAFSISVGIGILFGYLPARKAANLNPIDALRYE